MPLPAPAVCVKGIAIRAGLQWVSSTYGMGAVQAVFDAGSPELRKALVPELSSFGVLSSSWYTVGVVAELLDVVDAVTAPKDLQAHWREMATAVAADNVSGVYKSLFRLISSRTLLVAHAQRVWRSYFNDGQLVVTSPREGELVLCVRTTEHHESLCRTTANVVQQIFGRIGFKGATLARTRCRTRGASLCMYEVDYLV